MKLLTRITWSYLLVTLIVLLIGGVISYYKIKDEIDDEHARHFRNRIHRITYLLEKGKPPSDFKSPYTIIEQRPGARPTDDYRFVDTMAWHHDLQREVEHYKVSTITTINDTTYYIATYGVLVEDDDITEAITKALAWILVLILFVALVLAVLFSKRLIEPFKNTINKLSAFSVKQNQPLNLSESNVDEFDRLNSFLYEMTEKARSDFRQLKEFSENASHEMQTPVSIIKGKLELLMESDLKEDQAHLIESVHNAATKLTKLNKSLGLLNRIENKEFETEKTVDLSNLIKQSLTDFEELLQLNNLDLETDINDNVTLKLDPTLTDIMWSNLLNNAIQHNISGGYIDIELTAKQLTISNSGQPTDKPVDELFQRFKKGNQSSESIGLGLSIVSKICELNNIDISYRIDDNRHTFELIFA